MVVQANEADLDGVDGSCAAVRAYQTSRSGVHGGPKEQPIAAEGVYHRTTRPHARQVGGQLRRDGPHVCGANASLAPQAGRRLCLLR